MSKEKFIKLMAYIKVRNIGEASRLIRQMSSKELGQYDSAGDTALIAAAEYNLSSVCELLISKMQPADIGHIANDRNTALTIAIKSIEKGGIEKISTLLLQKMSLEAINVVTLGTKNTALSFAEKKEGYEKIVQAIKFTRLIKLIETGKTKEAQEAINQMGTKELAAIDADGNNVLHKAVYIFGIGDEIIGHLLDRLDNEATSACNNQGQTALHLSISNRKASIAELLVSKMSVEAINAISQATGKNALDLALEKHMGKLAEKLIKKMSPEATYAGNHNSSYFTKVVELIDRLLKTEESADLYLKKANILYGQGKKEAAMKCYEEALNSDPSLGDKIWEKIKPVTAEPVIAQYDSEADSDSYLEYSEILDSMIKESQVTTHPVQDRSYVVPHFHGFAFYQEYFTHEERREYGISKKHAGKHLHSKASYSNSALPTNKVLSTIEDDKLLELDKKIGSTIFSLNEHGLNRAIQTYVNTYSKNQENFLTLVRQRLQEEGVENVNNSPVVSTSKTPEHAFKFSIAHLEGDKTKIVDPMYYDDGTPKHRLAGVIFVTMHQLSGYDAEYKQDITWVTQGQIKTCNSSNKATGIHPHYRSQLEVTFSGGITEGPIVAAIPVVFPNLSDGHLGKSKMSSFYNKVFKSFGGVSGPSHYKSSVTSGGDYDTKYAGLIKRMEDAYTHIAIQIAHKKANEAGSKLVYVDSKGAVKYYPAAESPWSDIKGQIDKDNKCTSSIKDIKSAFAQYVDKNEKSVFSHKADGVLEIAINSGCKLMTQLIIDKSSANNNLSQALDDGLYNALKHNPGAAFDTLVKPLINSTVKPPSIPTALSPVNEWWDDAKVLAKLNQSGLSNTCIGSAVELNAYLNEYVIKGQDQKYLIALNVHAIEKNFTAHNHWVGLYIEKIGDTFEVIYVDPMGDKIDGGLQQNLQTLLGIPEIEQPLHDKGIQFAKLEGNHYSPDSNTDDCGPFTSYLLLSLLKDKRSLECATKLDSEKSKSLGQKLRKLFDATQNFDDIYGKVQDILKYGGTKEAYGQKLEAIKETLVVRETYIAEKELELSALKEKLQKVEEALAQQSRVQSDTETQVTSALEFLMQATSLLNGTLSEPDLVGESMTLPSEEA